MSTPTVCPKLCVPSAKATRLPRCVSLPLTTNSYRVSADFMISIYLSILGVFSLSIYSGPKCMKSIDLLRTRLDVLSTNRIWRVISHMREKLDSSRHVNVAMLNFSHRTWTTTGHATCSPMFTPGMKLHRMSGPFLQK